ncbi:MAG: GntR family transcriptional regulator [Sphingopyxis sp.]
MSSRKATNHHIIYELIHKAIASGEHAVGTLLPTEEQYCATHDASRYAVREALKRLEEDGMVARRRGSGTTVTSLSPVHTYRHGVRSMADLMNYAKSTHMKWLDDEHILTSGLLARQLGCDEGRGWQRLRGVRYEDNGATLGLVEAYIDTSIASVDDIEALNGGPVHSYIEERFGLTTAALSQDILAKALTPREAELLHDQHNAASLRIIRRYTSRTGLIYLISVNTFRSRDFVYNFRIELQ